MISIKKDVLLKNNIDFINKAVKIYKENPEKFGFAFWKYRELIKKATVYEKTINDINHMYAINNNRLIFYWSEDNNMVLSIDELENLGLLYIHSKYKNYIDKLRISHDISISNALIYNFDFDETKNNDEYYVDSFDFDDPNDYMSASKLLGYKSVQRIKDFTKLSVFDPKLWVFIKETKTSKPVSIGIAIYDKNIKETELEWIEVHKDHQGKSVGRMLINALVENAKSKSNIIRVGGVADNFYKKCGFSRITDKWLWVKRKGSNVGWWE